MDIKHLRKQARNLVRLYPELVAAHPASITLGTAQSALARLNGFPTWEAMITRQSTAPSASQVTPVAGVDLSRHLRFSIVGDETSLAVSYSSETGNPTRYRKGVEAMLSYTSVRDKRRALTEDEKLDGFSIMHSGPPSILPTSIWVLAAGSSCWQPFRKACKRARSARRPMPGWQAYGMRRAQMNKPRKWLGRSSNNCMR